MSDARLPQDAARLSEDIGDVLSAIRRLIAEDEALSLARDRIGAGHADARRAIDEDAAEFLARRHGGNAALARRMATGSEPQNGYDRPADLAKAISPDDDMAVNQPTENGDLAWPLGDAANAPGAARPRPVVPETPILDTPQPPQRIRRHLAADTQIPEPGRGDLPEARNDLVRTLSRAQHQHDGAENSGRFSPPRLNIVPRRATEAAPATSPLRLDNTRRVADETMSPAREATSGWRGWLRARPQTETVEQADDPQDPTLTAIDAQDEDAFAEAFDWKSRMRPDLPAAADFASCPGDAEAATSDADVVERAVHHRQRVSGGVSLPDNLYAGEAQHVARPAAGTGEAAFSDMLDAMASDDADATACKNDVAPHAIAPQKIASVMPDASHGKQGDDMGQLAGDASSSPAFSAAAESRYDTVTGLSPEDEEQSIRDLLRDMIQEELHGELGQRFARNLRAVIRREVAAAIDDQIDRF